MKKIKLDESDIRSMVFASVKHLIREGMYPTRFEYESDNIIYIDVYDLEDYSEEVVMILTEDLGIDKVKVKVQIEDNRIEDWSIMMPELMGSIDENQYEIINSVIGNYLRDNMVDILADLEVRKENDL